MKTIFSRLVLVFAVLGPNVSAFAALGETRVELDVAFGIRYVLPARVSVPPAEWVTIISAPFGGSNIWYKNSKPIPGATAPVLTIPSTTAADSGLYYYGPNGPAIPESGSQVLDLTVAPRTSLPNISTRAFAGPGEQTLIGGFIVGGTGTSTLLIRAVGPSLAKYGITGFLKQPKITIYTSDGKPYTNDFVFTQVVGAPSNKAELIQQVSAKVGAFPLIPGASDAVDVRPFPPGAYTVHVTSGDGSTGVVLLEITQSPE